MKIVLREPIMKKPPGGRYSYRDKNVTYEGDTPDALARKLGRYRATHGKPLGDPLADVMAYIYERWPYLCKVVNEDTEDLNGEDSQNLPLDERVYRWVLKQSASDSTVEMNHIQAERANICQNCPHNKPIVFSDHYKQQQFQRTAYIVSAGKMMGSFFRLGGCEKYGWDNRIMCAKKHASLPSDAPETCWIGKV